MEADIDLDVALAVFRRYGIDDFLVRVHLLEPDEAVFAVADYAAGLVHEQLVTDLTKVLGRQVYVTTW